MKPAPVTAEEVAARAGVSQSTVSRAFDPAAAVAPDTRARVLAVAAELGYRPNALAGSLSGSDSNIVGVVMANLAGSYFYPAVLERLTSALQERGRQTLLFNLPADRPVDEILPILLSYQIDGLIIASTTPSAATVARSVAAGTPVVLFNRDTPGPGAHSVACDAVAAARLVADALLDAGHRRPAFIAGPAATESSQQRETGFHQRLAERGITVVPRAEGAYTYQGGAAAARRLLDGADRPDAIFCAADIMALGVLDVARHELGLRVPEQLSVVGFDDIAPAAWPAYALTTIRQPLDRMVEDALGLLALPLDGAGEHHGRQIRHPGTLIRRRSARL